MNAIKSWIRQLLVPPVFEGDEDKTRAANLLNTISLILVVLTVVGTAILLVQDFAIELLVIGLAVILLELAVQALMRSGQVAFASVTQSLLLWITITYLAATAGGVRATTFSSYVLIIAIAGLLLGQQAGVGTAVLSVVAGIGMMYAESKGIMSFTETSPIEALVTQSVNFALLATILYLATRSINEALERTHRSNRELRAFQATLEQRVAERTSELEERTRELEASQRVTLAASEHATPNELLDLVVNLIRDQFDLYHAQVYLVDEEQQAAVLRQSTGYAGRQLLQRRHRIALNRTSLVTQAITTGEPVLVDDVTADPNFLANPLLPDTRSELVVPLKREGKVIGVLDIQDRTPGRFSPGTVALFQTMADQVTILFENSDLLERVTGQTEAMTLLTNQLRTAANIARRLGTILDPEQLLQEVVELIQSRFGLYHAHIYLVDEEAKLLKLETGSGEIGRVLKERGHTIPLSAEKSLVARAARTQGTVLVGDTAIESDFMPNPLLPQTRSELSIPMVVGKQVLGVLDLQDDQPNRFTEADRDTFTTLAGQIATALQNASLFATQQENEERFRSIVEHSHAGIIFLDSAYHFVYVNDEFCRITGYAQEELIGMDFRNILDEESVRLVADYYIRRQKGETVPSRYEFTIVRKDGEKRACEISSATFRDSAGNVRSVGQLMDITERKQAEEAVRESRQMLQTVMNSLPESIFWKDKNLVYLGCNTNFAHDAGFDSPDDVVGKTDFDMPWGEQAELYRADDTLVIQTGEAKINYEEPQTTPDGTTTWLRTSKVPLYDASGNPYAVLGAYADITSEKRTQAEIAKRAAELQTVAEVSTAAASILEPDELLSQVVELAKSNFDLYHVHIYLLNETGDTLELAAGAGEAGAQMIAQGWKIPADSTTSLVARAAHTREGVIVNDVREAPDFLPNPLLPDTRSELAVPLIVGERVLGVLDVQSDAVDHFTPQDVVIQTTLAGQIATALDNARLFRETQGVADQLRQVDGLKSEFLANMSHELRTPLNSIIGYTQLLLMDLEGEIPGESFEDMQAIETNSQHLLNLINDILDLAKIEAGRLELNKEEVEINTLLDAVRNNNAGLFIDSPLTFEVEVEEALPTIRADHIRIMQVLNNLISNAAKFTEEGGVTVRAFRENDNVCISVADTGIGISQEDLDTIFERFRQVDGSFTRRAEGTGLGLPITRHLVEMHGGTLDVQSSLGEGSTFTIHIPVHSEETAASSA